MALISNIFGTFFAQVIENTHNLNMNMKKLFLIALMSVPMLAQTQRLDRTTESLMTTPTITFQQQQYNLGNATAPATTISVTADEKEFNKDWKEYLKTSLMIEGKKNSGYMSATNVVIPQWSSDTMSFHYKTEKDSLQNRKGR